MRRVTSPSNHPSTTATTMSMQEQRREFPLVVETTLANVYGDPVYQRQLLCILDDNISGDINRTQLLWCLTAILMEQGNRQPLRADALANWAIQQMHQHTSESTTAISPEPEAFYRRLIRRFHRRLAQLSPNTPVPSRRPSHTFIHTSNLSPYNSSSPAREMQSPLLPYVPRDNRTVRGPYAPLPAVSPPPPYAAIDNNSTARGPYPPLPAVSPPPPYAASIDNHSTVRGSYVPLTEDPPPPYSDE